MQSEYLSSALYEVVANRMESGLGIPLAIYPFIDVIDEYSVEIK